MAASTKAGLKDNPAMSFVMLTESQLTPPLVTTNGMTKEVAKQKFQRPVNGLKPSSDESQTRLSSQIEVSTRLFEILSSRSDIDHPICTECTELLLNGLHSRLAASTKERDAYINFLKELNNKIPSASEICKAEIDLADTKAYEEKALAELEKLEQEKVFLQDENADLESDARALDQEEEAFWRSRNAFALTLSFFHNTRDAINASYDHDTQQLERLQRTNVYNDTFCIGHDGYFGTINGLRLGRLPPPQNVDWTEINAAWGMTALLLATVADKLGFTFRGYRIKPMGSTSRIERIEYAQPPTVVDPTLTTRSPSTPTSRSSVSAQSQPQPKLTPLELFSSGDLPLGRTFLHRRFNDAMVAFLDCLRQLGEFVENSNDSNPHSPANMQQQAGGLKQPYKISKDRIGDVSIKLGTSQDEAWTRACKYTLTCCKFLLAHASNVGGSGGGRRGL